ncbi:MAG: sel1 repeat family protein [Deltaproteobacteria bacterium]|nr:sel1 repeat family protein [Deltaproteobacteria bacterium]
MTKKLRNGFSKQRFSGKGVPKNLKEAVTWYQKAAEQGHAGAQYNLAAAYTSGQGVKKDAKLSLKWMVSAAERGHQSAVNFFLKGAEKGNAAAQHQLGGMYLNGKGVPKNTDEGLKWYKKAAEQGYPNSHAFLGTI